MEARGGLRRDLLLAFGILLLAGPLVQEWDAQAAPRYSLTAAVVEHHTLELDRYEPALYIDRAQYRGHTYSDKAPYQPLLAVPALGLWDLVGGEVFPIRPDQDGAYLRLQDDVDHRGLWWVTLWSSTFPAIALAIATRRMVASVHPAQATAVAVAMAVGTLLLPFASLLFGHVLAALFVALAWSRLREPQLTVRRALVGGLWLGAAVGTEYTVALVAAVALVATWVAAGLARAAWLSVGTVVATLPLLLYNWLVFEDPFEVAYQGHLPNFQGSGALGVYNLTVPKGEEVWRALFSSKGLFVLTPVMVLAFAGCALAIRGRGPTRRDAVVALTCFVLLLAASTGIDGIGGASPGPRYLIPVLPLFAIPLAEAWRRVPRLAAAATAVGAAWMVLAAATFPLAASVRTWWEAAEAGVLASNVVTGHSRTELLVIPTVAGLVLLVELVRRDPDRLSRRGAA